MPHASRDWRLAWSRWKVAYYLLATAQLLVALVATIAVVARIDASEHVRARTAQWARQQAILARLSRLATDANAPGNDVFVTRDVAGEHARLRAASARLEEALRAARQELSTGLDPAEAEALAARLDAVGQNVASMTTAAESLFREMRTGDVEEAASRMAAMDRSLVQVRREMDGLATDLAALHVSEVRAQSAVTSRIAGYQYAAVAALLFLGIAVVVHAFVTRRRMAAEARERDRVLEELRRSEARFRSLSASSPVALLELDADGRCRFASAQWNDLTGLDLESSMGAGWLAAIHPDDRDGLLAGWSEASAGSRGFAAQVRLLDARDDTRHVEVQSAPVAGQGSRVMAVADVTERHLADQALREANEQLQGWAARLESRNREIMLLSEMGELLQASLREEEAFRVAATYLPQVFPGHGGSFYLLDDDKHELRLAAQWGHLEGCPDSVAASECWALRRGRMHAVREAGVSAPCDAHCLARAGGYLCVPMIVQGEALGVMKLEGSPGPGAPAPATVDKQLAGTAAEQLGLVLAGLRLRDRLRQQTVRDPLTRLYNRRHLDEVLPREAARAALAGTKLGLITFDIDHFKALNDRLGHAAGDAALQAVADVVRAHVRDEDVACRQGGEEFVILMPGAGRSMVAQRAEELRRALWDIQLTVDGETVGPLTASFGAAVHPEDGADVREALRAADGALYRAKRDGRNRVVHAGEPAAVQAGADRWGR